MTAGPASRGDGGPLGTREPCQLTAVSRPREATALPVRRGVVVGKETALLSPRRRHQPKSAEPRPPAAEPPVPQRWGLDASRRETRPYTPQNTASGKGHRHNGQHDSANGLCFPSSLKNKSPAGPYSRPHPRTALMVSAPLPYPGDGARRRKQSGAAIGPEGACAEPDPLGPGPEGSSRMRTRGGGASLGGAGGWSTWLSGRGVGGAAAPLPGNRQLTGGLTVGG